MAKGFMTGKNPNIMYVSSKDRKDENGDDSTSPLKLMPSLVSWLAKSVPTPVPKLCPTRRISSGLAPFRVNQSNAARASRPRPASDGVPSLSAKPR